MLKKDIAEKELAKEIKEHLIEIFFPHLYQRDLSSAENWPGKSIFIQSVACKKCGKNVALSLTEYYPGGQIHIILNPCTRIVIGIHPEIRHSIEENTKRIVAFGWGDSYFICLQCNKEMGIPELVVRSAPELKECLDKNPIINMSPFDKNKGCWLTITEFPLNGQKGRFLNYQTDFDDFVRILKETGLCEDYQRIKNHLG